MKTDRIVTLLAGSVMLTAVSAIITHYAVTVSRDRLQWVFHTYTVMEKTDELLSSLEDMEQEQQRYLISDNSLPGTSYNNAAKQIPLTIDTLLHLAADNPQQIQLLQEKILPLIRQKQKAIETNIAFRNHQTTHRDTTTTKQIKNLLKAFNNNEQELLQNRLMQAGETHQRQIIIRNVCFSVIGVVSLLALFTIIQKQRKNDVLIQQLNLANETLDEKVTSRTLELQKQNNFIEELNLKLQESMEEMESFYEALQIRSVKAEDTLKEIRDLYDNAPCGYHSLNADGIIVRMNKTELTWLGYTAEEVIGKMPAEKIIIPEEYRSYRDEFPGFKKQGHVRNKKHTFVRKDGSTFPILLNATAIYDSQGNFVMSRGTVIDVSELHLMEQRLLDVNKRLLQLNDEKNHFLGIAAHDLRSPLNSVLGLINLIQLNAQNLTPQQQEYLHFMNQSCVNMQMLISNLLDISRIEQGLHTTSFEEIDLSALLHQQWRVFQEVAQKKNITVILEDHAPRTTITSDANALQRILDNLISNAIKFSPENKDVVLRVVREKTFIKIEVIDQGPGIRQDEMSRLFQKFQRLSARPTNGESSTGLGLSIVKELIHILHGKIAVESEVNKGSKFIVELPL